MKVKSIMLTLLLIFSHSATSQSGNIPLGDIEKLVSMVNSHPEKTLILGEQLIADIPGNDSIYGEGIKLNNYRAIMIEENNNTFSPIEHNRTIEFETNEDKRYVIRLITEQEDNGIYFYTIDFNLLPDASDFKYHSTHYVAYYEEFDQNENHCEYIQALKLETQEFEISSTKLSSFDNEKVSSFIVNTLYNRNYSVTDSQQLNLIANQDYVFCKEPR